MAKFVVDEDMPRSTCIALVEEGYEVKDVRDHGHRGAADEEIYKFAQEEKVPKAPFPSFQRKPESRFFEHLQNVWTPVFTGVTALETFYDSVKFEGGFGFGQCVAF